MAEFEIHAPDGGWKAHTWYLADVSMFKGNPIFKALLFTGFLDNGKPTGYSGFFPANSAPIDGSHALRAARYVKAIKELYTNE